MLAKSPIMFMYVWLVSVCPLVEHTRDLGITVTNDLSPSHHIAVIVIRAHKRAGGILRAFSSRDICLLMRAFLVYVRPIVGYNYIIWSLFLILIQS